MLQRINCSRKRRKRHTTNYLRETTPYQLMLYFLCRCIHGSTEHRAMLASQTGTTDKIHISAKRLLIMPIFWEHTHTLNESSSPISQINSRVSKTYVGSLVVEEVMVVSDEPPLPPVRADPTPAMFVEPANLTRALKG